MGSSPIVSTTVQAARLPADDCGACDALEAFFGIGDSGASEPFDIEQIRFDAAEPRLEQ